MPMGNGQVFAGYTVVRLLGAGVMGEVYLVRHPRLPRQEALKILPVTLSADPEYRERFAREADLAAALWHPHITAVHDRGVDDGQLWLTMDYVDGIDLAEVVHDDYPRGMPVEDVVDIVYAVADALDYAHEQRLLHRRVTPANILLTGPRNGQRRIVLTDFGIARHADDANGSTATNIPVGAVHYSAPEQLMGEHLDGRADQYSLAATAYYLLTGSAPFAHTNSAVVIGRHLNTPPPRLAEIHPELAPLDAVLTRAMAKDPADRYVKCLEFAAELAGHADTVGADHSATAIDQPRPPATPPVNVTAPDSDQLAPPITVSDWGAAQHDDMSNDLEEEPQTAISPSPSPARKDVSRVLIGAAIVTAVVLVAMITFVLLQATAGDSPTAAAPSKSELSALTTPSPAPESQASAPPPPTVPAPPTFSASSIDSALLSTTEINDALGTYATGSAQRTPMMKLDDSSYGMSDNSALVTPQGCVGLVFGAEHRVYADTGFEEFRDQTFRPETYVVDKTISPPYVVEQTVAVYPTVEQAQAVLTSSLDQWQSCARSTVTEDVPPENSREFELGTVQRNGWLLTVAMAANSYVGAAACQQVLGVRANVVVGNRVCNFVEDSAATTLTSDGWPTNPAWASNDAERLAQAMLDKVV